MFVKIDNGLNSKTDEATDRKNRDTIERRSPNSDIYSDQTFMVRIRIDKKCLVTQLKTISVTSIATVT